MTDMTPDELRAWISPATSHGVHINSKTLSAIAQTALDALDREAAMKAELARVRTDCGILLAQIDAIEDATGEGPEGEDALLVAQIRASLPTEYERKLAQLKEDFPNGI